FHAYEGHPMEVLCAPVRVARRLGVHTCIFTNAAGGAAPRLGPGSLMLIDDHINLLWRSPLAGPVLDGETRFPDMSAPYDPALQRLALEVARDARVPLERGTYAAVLGPSYETPAEVRMLRWMGADAIGMSTVPEVITARAAGLRVLGFSLITNRAAGLSGQPLSHDEVVEVGRRAGARLEGILRGVLRRLPD
ncbi:MAG: purine-nucleoside phosphorylase, partial [Gemmatimonadetes bacterium]